MSSRRLKPWYFFLEGLNAFAASYFFNYLFFHLRDQFGFGSRANLLVAALHGLVYMCFAWPAGRYAQRRGYFAALRVGFAGMGLPLVLGSCFPASATVQIGVFALWTLGMSFTWPALEALASEGEPPEGLPRMIGIYNVVWAGAGALAFFTGGAIFQALGTRGLYFVPAALHGLQLALVAWLARQTSGRARVAERPAMAEHQPEAAAYQQPVSPQVFLQMAWWANPFAYIAMNTVQPVIPSIAQRLELSTAAAGVFASVWLFARLGTFALLWKWTGWHYRFRWLLASFVLLVASFAGLLLLPSLGWLVAAQLAFGLAVGQIYYSSLFYSMDVGETKGEHGGLHEAAIGVGLFLGPTVGGAAVYLVPSQPHASVWAVGALLVAGLAGLAGLRLRRRRRVR
jgi:predicted MFS family arabinose efflux permease